jgi:hypothetical protein
MATHGRRWIDVYGWTSMDEKGRTDIDERGTKRGRTLDGMETDVGWNEDGHQSERQNEIDYDYNGLHR